MKSAMEVICAIERVQAWQAGRCEWRMGNKSPDLLVETYDGRYTPQTSRRVSLTSPNVARTRTASIILGNRAPLPAAALRISLRVAVTASLSRDRFTAAS